MSATILKISCRKQKRNAVNFDGQNISRKRLQDAIGLLSTCNERLREAS